MQGLDFTPYMSEASAIEGSAPYTYDLAGVCAHDGKSVNCGHYRAVCRSALAPRLPRKGSLQCQECLLTSQRSFVTQRLDRACMFADDQIAAWCRA